MTPTENIKTAENLSEKYLRINQDFPNLAGKFMQLSRAQRRLIEKISRSKQNDDQKELLVGSAEMIEVGEELVNWTYRTLTEVGADAKSLLEAAKLRDELRFANELVGEYLSK